MKTIEEKAKAYDEALEKARRKLRDTNNRMSTEFYEATNRFFEEIFPELKESEDERIRKWLILDIKQSLEDNIYNDENIEEAKKALAWLEKQGEQKPVEWSEEDEARVDRIIDILDWAEEKRRINYSDWEEYVGYIKTLRPRDEYKFYKIDYKIQKEIITYFEAMKEHEPTKKKTHDKWINWLKSLRPQSHWKPTEMQLKCLKDACDEHWEPDGLDPLYTLYEQLKAL